MFELINVIFCDYQHGELHMSRKRVILDFPCLFLNARTIEHATGNSNKKPKRETDKRVREILGKQLKWQLIPLRLKLETFQALKRVALDGDVKKLIKETIQKIIQV